MDLHPLGPRPAPDDASGDASGDAPGGAVPSAERPTPVATMLAAASAPLGVAEAHAAARSGDALLAPRDDVFPLRLTGTDRIDFLHGQISAPLRGRPVGAFEPGLLLDHRGHARAQLGVALRADDLFVAVAGGAGSHVEAELRRHIVFDQVDLAPLPAALGAVTVLNGAPALARLGWAAPDAGAFAEAPFGDARLLLHREVAAPAGAVTLHALRRQLPEVIAALLGAGARAVGADALELLRVAAGAPLAPADAGAGVLPQEAGLEPLVSTRKGCYLGQEIMARIEARGRLKRSLAGLRLEPPADASGGEATSPPAPGAELRADDCVVGRLGSAARHPELGWIALAVLRNDVGEGAGDERAGDAAAEDAEAVLETGGWRARRAALPFDAPLEPAPG